jgi:hypothetical protein
LYNLGVNPYGEPTTNNLVEDPCELTNIYDPATPPVDLVTRLKVGTGQRPTEGCASLTRSGSFGGLQKPSVVHVQRKWIGRVKNLGFRGI